MTSKQMRCFSPLALNHLKSSPLECGKKAASCWQLSVSGADLMLLNNNPNSRQHSDQSIKTITNTPSSPLSQGKKHGATTLLRIYFAASSISWLPIKTCSPWQGLARISSSYVQHLYELSTGLVSSSLLHPVASWCPKTKIWILN